MALPNRASYDATARCVSGGIRAEGPADYLAPAAGRGMRVELPIRAAGPADCSLSVAGQNKRTNEPTIFWLFRRICG